MWISYLRNVEPCDTNQEAVFGKGSLESVLLSNQPSRSSNYPPAEDGRRKKKQNKQQWIHSNIADNCLELKINLFRSCCAVGVKQRWPPELLVPQTPTICHWFSSGDFCYGAGWWEQPTSLSWKTKPVSPFPYSLICSCFHLTSHWWEPTTSGDTLKLEGQQIYTQQIPTYSRGKSTGGYTQRNLLHEK